MVSGWLVMLRHERLCIAQKEQRDHISGADLRARFAKLDEWHA